MKKTIKPIARLLIVTLFFTLIGCSEDIYEDHVHNDNQINKNEISFKQFKGETGMKKFESLKSVKFGNHFSRAIESEFLTDTTKILKYTSVNNKVTYSFKIYPTTEILESKEYYNLVYEKYGNEWNELIFLNKEREIQQLGESKLESSKMVYNEKLSTVSMSGICEVVNYTIQCDGSCALQGWLECDGFACSTGQCIHESVSYVYCGNNEVTEEQPFYMVDSPENNGSSAGNYSGIYIPNPYGSTDLNSPDFIFATQVAAFTRTLPTNLKNLMKNNFWMYPKIIDFMSNNGGITQENKDAVIFALTNSIPVFNLSLPNWSFTDINQLHYNTFIYLLQNPNLQGAEFVNEVINASIILEVDAFSVWDDYDNFRNQMSITEKAIFDNMLPNRKLWYMVSSKKAFDKANELFPNSTHNGKGDAFRHALWNGLCALTLAGNLGEQLTTAHENRPSQYPFNYKETEMDLYNNEKGRQVAILSNLTNIVDNILQYLNNGYLRYLNNLDPNNNNATYNSILIPTDQ